MKTFLMIAAALLISAAPARADDAAQAAPAIAQENDHSGFGVNLFTNVSPAGFEDPASAAAIASSVDPNDLANMAPAAGEETDTAIAPAVNTGLDAGSIIAPAAAGVAQ